MIFFLRIREQVPYQQKDNIVVVPNALYTLFFSVSYSILVGGFSESLVIAFIFILNVIPYDLVQGHFLLV